MHWQKYKEILNLQNFSIELTPLRFFIIRSTLPHHLGYSLMPQEVQALQRTLASLVNLEAVESDGQNEITDGLYPQDAKLGHYIAEVGSHGVQTDIGTGAKRRGEQPRNTLPIAGDAGLRPTDTCEKQQGDGDEDHQQHDILTILDRTRHEHTEEDAGDDEGKHHVEQRPERG